MKKRKTDATIEKKEETEAPPPPVCNKMQKENEITDLDEYGSRIRGEAREPMPMNEGGEVPGQGDTDTVPAMLTPGEFVLTKDAVKKVWH